MKRFLLSLSIFTACFLSGSLDAQMTTFRFTYDVGLFDISGGMVQNPAGEFVFAGINNSFGPYYGDAVKIDASGTVVWAKAYNGGFATNISDIKNVSTGGYIMTGQSSSAGGGALLIRIDNAGAVLWAFKYQLPDKPAANASNEYGNAVIETSDGGFLVGGGVDYFWDGVSPTTTDTTSAMGFKVNSSGVLQWSKVWTIATANPDEHYINDVAESADGYFFVGQSSEGTGTLSSNGDYPSNALIIKTTTAGALTYIRRWGAGNATSQGINAATKLTTGNILLGGFDDVSGFLVSISGVGAAPAVIYNHRLNGALFGSTYLIQDIMECADGNYSIIGTQLVFLSVQLNTMIVKLNSSTGALMFGRTYAPIGLSAILPEGGLCTDQGYYVVMTDQQVGGFNANVIRTNTVGQTNDPASGCPGTSINPTIGTITVTFTTPTSSNFNLAVGSSFSPVVTNLIPVRTQHCFNAPSALSATSTSTNVTCFGGCNGTATATPANGTAPYTYLWAPSGGTAATATGLCAGTYTCTVTDAASVSTTTSVTITQPAATVATISATPIECSTGWAYITVNVTSGVGPYTYAWSPSGGNTNVGQVFVAGNYTCTITNGAGCTSTQSITVVPGPAPTCSITSSSNNLCFGNTNGTATVTASSGMGPYTYSWSPSGGTGATASNLAAGTYTVTVTDFLGCQATSTIVITAPSQLTSTSSQTNVLCNGGNNGTATVAPTGGTPGYTYSWAPSGGTAATASGLAPNTYTCTITDGAGCTTTQNFTITQPTVISASATSTPTGCSTNTGSATCTANGGTGILTYSWAPSGGTAATAINLGVGNYTVTVTDANGCTSTANASIITAGGPTASLQSSSNVNCFGSSTGTASVTASGNSPFTYSWSPSGGNAATANGLIAGGYTCTITDINGCASTQSVLITEPTAIVASASSTPTGCSASTGSATCTANGGTGSLTYSWSPSGGTSATANNLAAGPYVVTITDANGCTTTANTTVTSVGGPTTSVQTTTNVACFGNNTGASTITASGNGPLTYSWAPIGGNAATGANLSAGTYTVTVTDINGCVSAQTVTITEPTVIAPFTSSNPATCGNTNGDATVSVTGGTGPYTYLWNNSQTTATISNLAGGSYNVTVTDANGCTSTATVNVTNTGAPTVSLQSSSNVSCFGGTTGSATVLVSGGSSPYTYAWSPSGGTSASATNLGAGTYTITVTGSDGCTQTQTVTLTQPTAIALTSNAVAENCGSADGSASVAASGGTPGYTYVWSNAATNDSISNLSAGSYSVTATDANGCTTSSTVVVTNNSTAVANAGASVTITSGQTVQLLGTGGVTYSWTPSGTLSCSNCQNPVASPTATTIYMLTVTDSNGCTDTDTITVYVDIACGEVYVPNAFSPNGDHQNDMFYVRGNCIKYLDFSIYNRWGEKVFYTADPAMGWDGTWRNVACENAVFTYYLKATLLDGTEIDRQGNISLVK